ncbi:MAG: hypothetical protein WC985_07160 [Thermoplasmata archaeon]
MAKEHHCPNCGAQPCNASTSKIHTCGICAAVWEEVISEPRPAPSPAPKPAGSATSAAAPKPPAPPAPAQSPA